MVISLTWIQVIDPPGENSTSDHISKDHPSVKQNVNAIFFRIFFLPVYGAF